MRTTLWVLAAGALLLIPVVGQVQQVPGEPTRRPGTIAELQELMKAQTDAIQDILRLYGVVIIVGLSALLLVAGFSNDQLTPIVGLFGAIAGYLLGKETKTTKGDE